MGYGIEFFFEMDVSEKTTKILLEGEKVHSSKKEKYKEV